MYVCYVCLYFLSFFFIIVFQEQLLFSVEAAPWIPGIKRLLGVLESNPEVPASAVLGTTVSASTEAIEVRNQPGVDTQLTQTSSNSQQPADYRQSVQLPPPPIGTESAPPSTPTHPSTGQQQPVTFAQPPLVTRMQPPPIAGMMGQPPISVTAGMQQPPVIGMQQPIPNTGVVGTQPPPSTATEIPPIVPPTGQHRTFVPADIGDYSSQVFEYVYNAFFRLISCSLCSITRDFLRHF